MATGLSREPVKEETTGPFLGDFAKVLREIATGANEFFFLTTRQAANLGIPDEFLVPAVGRTRDIIGDEISSETINTLDSIDSPTLLFSPDGRTINSFPQHVQEYLKKGEAMELHKKR